MEFVGCSYVGPSNIVERLADQSLKPVFRKGTKGREWNEVCVYVSPFPEVPLALKYPSLYINLHFTLSCTYLLYSWMQNEKGVEENLMVNALIYLATMAGSLIQAEIRIISLSWSR